MKKAVLLISSLLILAMGCGQNDAQTDSQQSGSISARADSARTDANKIDSTRALAPLVTFIELGSVNCVPCKMMQPVMQAIEAAYGAQIKIIFHDVWKDRAPAQQYRIRVIPTQVFLDEKGQEFFRHEGFFPQEAIEKLLTDRGLKKKAAKQS